MKRPLEYPVATKYLLLATSQSNRTLLSALCLVKEWPPARQESTESLLLVVSQSDRSSRLPADGPSSPPRSDRIYVARDESIRSKWLAPAAKAKL